MISFEGKKRKYIVLKALNNNVILAKDISLDEEIVLVGGKGIGFGKRDGNVVHLNKEDVEKTFYLSDPKTKK